MAEYYLASRPRSRVVKKPCFAESRFLSSSGAFLITRFDVVTLAPDLRSHWWLDSQVDEEYRLRRLPLPACDHSAGDLAVFSIHLSFRDVEDLLAERGITVSYETVRRWVNHFGPMIAADLRRRRPKPYSTWHLDEVYLKISGRMVYLWRAVDAEGEVIDVLVQSKQACRAETDAQTPEEMRVRPRSIDHRRFALVCCRRP
jgi:hypothetical protein